MDVRLAAVGDVPQLAVLMSEVYRTFGEDVPPPDATERFLQEALASGTFDVVVAEDAGRIVGLLTLAFCPTSFRRTRFAWLDDFHVAEPSRGRGIGRALLGFAAGHAARRGAAEIKLTCEPDNARLARLYEAAAYAPSPMRLMVRALPVEAPRP